MFDYTTTAYRLSFLFTLEFHASFIVCYFVLHVFCIYNSDLASIRLHFTYLCRICILLQSSYYITLMRLARVPLCPARRGGAEVAGWTLDRKIRVRFPAYPHRVWAL